MELDEAILYRMAYGLAGGLAEGREDVLAGRWRSHPAAGGPEALILAEVLRRLAVAEEPGRELVREAVEDALARRRPRW